MKIKDISLVNPKSNRFKDFINYIDTSSVLDGTISNVQRIENDYPSRAQRELNVNDILISSVRPNLRHNCFIKKPIEHGIASTGFIQIRVNNDKWLSSFIYYFLTTNKMIEHYTNIANSSTTTFPAFNKEVIEQIGLPQISLEEQRHIVDTIGTIDNLIEKNEEIITNARSLINAFYDTIIVETGNSILKDFFVITIGRTPPTKESKWFNSSSRGSMKWLSIKDMAQNSTYIFETSQFLTNDALKKFNIPIVKEGDVLLSFKLTVGRTAIAGANMVTNEAIACFKANSEYRNYLFCYLQRCNFLSDGDNTSSIGKAVNSTIIKNFPFVIPSKESLDTFNKKTHSLFELIKLKQKENITLKTQKATLLCKYFPSN